MVQWVEHFPHKCESLSSVPQIHIELVVSVYSLTQRMKWEWNIGIPKNLSVSFLVHAVVNNKETGLKQVKGKG